MPSIITFRQGTAADSYDAFCIFEETLADLLRRLGNTEPTSWANPDELAQMWQKRRPMYEHLAQTADQFWIAEQDGRPIGFVRSVLRDGVRQLTELFVKPGVQSAGAGREFISRTFPAEGARRKSIIATADTRAQNLYIKLGVYPRFPVYYFGCTPKATFVETDLIIEPVTASPETLETLGTIDRTIIEYRRDVDHAWLLSQRQGYLYYRDGQPVGYGYVGINSGPFALLNAADFPAVLAHAENEAAGQGRDHFGVEVPTINLTAVNYLLSRGFWLDAFVAVMMTDQPFGKFENYICTSPPFFM